MSDSERMERPFIPRTLTYTDAKRNQAELRSDELPMGDAPQIILGEAGMGKTELMRRLGEAEGACYVTARKLLRAPDPRQLIANDGCLIIDALDEAPAVRDGDAVDKVLGKLASAGCPRFVLSCRVADWRSATATSAIAEDYGSDPIEFHLAPLSRDEAVQFLTHSLRPARAQEVADHFTALGPADLLGNPQTLLMIETVAKTGSLPETRGELYERAVAELRREHKREKEREPLARLSEEAALNAAGAAFAALIMTGKEAISRAPSGSEAESDVHIGDVAALPGGADIDMVLGSRLFRGSSDGRFFPLHRTVAEFLGARWLARQADTRRKRKRLIAMLQRDGLVPASLRGIHAWLAREAQLAPAVIGADPMGVIQYGDADRLTVEQGRALLAALKSLDESNPGFRSGSERHSIRGIVRSELIDDLRLAIGSGGGNYGFRALLMDALVGSPVAAMMSDQLRAALLDVSNFYGLRDLAGHALVSTLGKDADWPALVEALVALGDDESLSIAVEMLSTAGFELFSDDQVVETVFARVKQAESSSLTGSLIDFARKVPDERLDGILDLLCARASQEREDKDEGHASDDLTDAAVKLITRRLKFGLVLPLRLWAWIEPFNSDHGYQHEERDEITAWLDENAVARRAILQHVLLDPASDESFFQRRWALHRTLPGLSISIGDVVALLANFGTPNRSSAAEVERWKGVVRLVQHGPDAGREVREAARTFAGTRKGLNQFLDQLEKPHVTPAERKFLKRQEQKARKRKANLAIIRKKYRSNLSKVRAGVFGWIIDPAKAYLNMLNDIEPHDCPLTRIDLWLGEDVRNAALQGFETFYGGGHPPSATDIAASNAQRRGWEAQYIIFAAIAERLRTGVGFSDLTDERLFAAQISLEITPPEEIVKLEGLYEAVETELRNRAGAWEACLRLLIEPQLRERCDHISGLHSAVRRNADSALMTTLGTEWLDHFPDMSDAAETDLVDRLAASNAVHDLRRISRARAAAGWRDEAQRRKWQAVDIFFDFDVASTALAGAGERDPELLWSLRHRTGRGLHEPISKQAISPRQVAWIVSEFRAAWPQQSFPRRNSGRSTDGWNASRFITSIISSLGDDVSDEAIAALVSLRDGISDGYTPHLQAVAAEQKRKRMEQDFAAPDLATLRGVIDDTAPTTAADLQAVMLEELEVVQAKLDGHPVDWHTGFFDGKRQPLDEEACRDELMKMLGDYPEGILCVPEGHLANDKRADIQCTIGELMLPIEIKGQWHNDLWTAAETQLDRQYASDWRADRYGIYLVFWFGRSVADRKKPKAPPKGIAAPNTADEMQVALTNALPAALQGRIAVVVLDLTDPKARTV